MKNEKKKQFETSDFYLAAFCLANGLKLISINRDNPHRALFVFEDTENREGWVEDFLFSRARIEPKRFVSAIKELKQLLHFDL